MDLTTVENIDRKPEPPRIAVIRVPGLAGYGDMLARQHARCREVGEEGVDSALFLLEHRPVITLGRNAHAEHLLRSREALAAMGIETAEADRGGDVTYHGPGQLVAYPILNLNCWRCSVSWYLRTLEEVVIRTLAEYGLRGERLEGHTGVGVGGAKVAAIGVGLRQWTTFHGVAINVSPDMGHFSLIVPCGIADKPVTSLERLLGTPLSMADAMDAFEGCFMDCFCGRKEACNIPLYPPSKGE